MLNPECETCAPPSLWLSSLMNTFSGGVWVTQHLSYFDKDRKFYFHQLLNFWRKIQNSEESSQCWSWGCPSGQRGQLQAVGDVVEFRLPVTFWSLWVLNEASLSSSWSRPRPNSSSVFIGAGTPWSARCWQSPKRRVLPVWAGRWWGWRCRCPRGRGPPPCSRNHTCNLH